MLLVITVNIIAFYYATWNYISIVNFDYFNTILCIISSVFIYSKRDIILSVTRNAFWILAFSVVFSSALLIGKAIYYTSLR